MKFWEKNLHFYLWNSENKVWNSKSNYKSLNITIWISTNNLKILELILWILNVILWILIWIFFFDSKDILNNKVWIYLWIVEINIGIFSNLNLNFCRLIVIERALIRTQHTTAADAYGVSIRDGDTSGT